MRPLFGRKLQKFIAIHLPYFIFMYYSKQGGLPPLCKEDYDAQAYYQPLQSGISGTTSKRWVSMQNRSSGLRLSSTELAVHGLNAAFVEAEKSARVMNVVPIKTTNTLPLILDQGFAGVLHDWM
ncbi:hypothetical protein GIB67_041978 [Kingdonia uniflora]|uniref:Methyltransferase n=1 Tax=Kingdonia uniflora TaxID=39325 RepID=A0A7J7NZP6_9MAGN|nr:hypothetical protein GIB67_041978 [Kingdonia uniflora]